MRRQLLPTLALLLVCLEPARAGLDLSLKHEKGSDESSPMENTFITDGDSKIYIQIPKNWRTFDGAQAINCAPDLENSTVKIEVFPGTKPLSIDNAGAQNLLQQVTKQIPEGAKNIQTVALEIEPLPYLSWKTLEVTVSYEMLGQKMHRSLMYISMLPTRNVMLTVIAQDADFDKLHKLGRKVMCSWFEPTRDLPPGMQNVYQASKGGS